MRLIDADALLEQYGLKDATKYGNENAEQRHKSYGTLMMYEIADMIYDAPTIEPPANWTPCSVGLPENQSDVLIYFDRCGGEIGIGYYGERADGVKFWCVMGSMLCYNVLAWQPLPEPYRGGE